MPRSDSKRFVTYVVVAVIRIAVVGPPLIGRSGKGFQRVTLRPGQTTRVTFAVSRNDLAWRNGHWGVTPGTYALMVGDSSADLPLTAHVEVK